MGPNIANLRISAKNLQKEGLIYEIIFACELISTSRALPRFVLWGFVQARGLGC